MAQHIAVVAGIRTAYARAGTVFANYTAVDLGRLAISEVLARAAVEPEAVDSVIIGNVVQPVEAVNVARVIALMAGIPESVPAFTVHRNCASGMQAIASAADLIAAGRAELVVAGGVESMSNIPFFLSQRLKQVTTQLLYAKTLGKRARAVLSLRPKDFIPRIGLLLGLTDPTCRLSMGQTAEVLARELGISRESQDAFALTSHQKALAAQAEGRFKDEIMTVMSTRNEEEAVTLDNGVRHGETMEVLAGLKPAFDRRYGTVTAGNASQVTDGGAAVLVASEKAVSRFGFTPLGYVKDFEFAGLSPKRMGLGPAYATSRLLERTKTKFDDIGLIEMNEAFAAQVIANEMVFRDDGLSEHFLGRKAIGEIDRNILNVNGGAIAMGHPVGSSGTRLVLTLLLEMQRRKTDTGLATLCVGGGQGAAMLLGRRA